MPFVLPTALILAGLGIFVSSCSVGSCSYPSRDQIHFFSSNSDEVISHGADEIELTFYPSNSATFRFHTELNEQLRIGGYAESSEFEYELVANAKDQPPMVLPKRSSSVEKKALNSANPLKFKLHLLTTELEEGKTKVEIDSLGYYVIPKDVSDFQFRVVFYPVYDCLLDSAEGYLSDPITVSLR